MILILSLIGLLTSSFGKLKIVFLNNFLNCLNISLNNPHWVSNALILLIFLISSGGLIIILLVNLGWFIELCMKICD